MYRVNFAANIRQSRSFVKFFIFFAAFDDGLFEVTVSKELMEDGSVGAIFVDVKNTSKRAYSPELKADPCGIEVNLPFSIRREAKTDLTQTAAKEIADISKDVNEIYDYLKEIGYIKYDSLKDYPAD